MADRRAGTEKAGALRLRGPVAGGRRAAGFSLLELTLVMAVTVLLTGLLLPVLAQIRETAHRVLCSSNLRQIGLMTMMWTNEHHERLPPSRLATGERGNLRDMMAAHLGEQAGNWEGLGHLYEWKYCTAAQIFYCPSHIGDHPFERYSNDWPRYRYDRFQEGEHYPVGGPIYMNYHYAGDVRWEDPEIPLNLDRDAAEIVVATDGMRTSLDFNHRTGLNLLRGDGSVTWREDAATKQVADMLPGSASSGGSPPPDFRLIWQLLAE